MSVVISLEASVRDGLPADPPSCAGAIGAIDPERVLARSRTTECAVVVLPCGVRTVRKSWRWPRRSDRVRGVLRTTFAARSPARREFEGLLRLRALPTGPFAPRPLGIVEERRTGVLVACTLLVEEVPGAADLATFLRDATDAARRRGVLADLGRRTRDMHEAGLSDGEHHPRNVLVLPVGSGTLRVDCAKQRVSRRPVRGDAALRDLASLDVGLVAFGTEEERRVLAGAWLGPGASADAVAGTLRRIATLRSAIEERESRRLPPSPPATA